MVVAAAVELELRLAAEAESLQLSPAAEGPDSVWQQTSAPRSSTAGHSSHCIRYTTLLTTTEQLSTLLCTQEVIFVSDLAAATM